MDVRWDGGWCPCAVGLSLGFIEVLLVGFNLHVKYGAFESLFLLIRLRWVAVMLKEIGVRNMIAARWNTVITHRFLPLLHGVNENDDVRDVTVFRWVHVLKV